MSRKPYLKYILVFGVLSVAIAVIAVMTARRTPAPRPAATAEEATPPEAPPIHATDDEPAENQIAIEQPAEEQPTFETFAPDDDLDFVLELSEIIDNREDDFKERERERFEKAREELDAKLSQPGGGRIALMEEFLDEFGISGETCRHASKLAGAYSRAERMDDAKRIYRDLIASLPESRLTVKLPTVRQLALAEQKTGNFAAAEALLLSIIEAPVSKYYEQDPHSLHRLQSQQKFDAPLSLAGVYTEAGRFEEASRTLDSVIAAALALPKDHASFGSVPGYVGQAYKQRIDLLVAQTQPEGIDEATDAAFALINDYEETLAGIAWPNPERSLSRIANSKDRLRIAIVSGVCRTKVETLFESADAGSLDEAVVAADRLVEEYRALGNEHAWHEQYWADSFQRYMDGIKDWASKTAEKKRAEP